MISSNQSIRRISLFGGPGSGKSSLAAMLFFHLKKMNIGVELVSEYLKFHAYEKRPIEGFFQIYTFAQQMEMEDRFLRNGVKLIITDSPLMLQCMYAKSRGERIWQPMVDISLEFEKTYPSFNIMLDRDGIAYQPDGRYQKDLNEALKVDDQIIRFLASCGICGDRLHRKSSLDVDGVVRLVSRALENAL